jgi:hypothetical protein
VAIVIPAEGAILDRVLDSAHLLSPEGLTRHAYGRFDAALMRTAWGYRHRRRFALMEGSELLASALQHELVAVLDGHPVRVCGISQIVPRPSLGAGESWRELVDRLLQQAASDGAALAVLFSSMTDERPLAGFDVIPMRDLDIAVAEPLRRGAPMTLIRGGEERDLAAIAAMGRFRAESFRFYLDRDVGFEQYAITNKRLLAGLGTVGARQLHFFIAEEGITAAAYVVISVTAGTWTIEECGDRDPSGARVGAILQTLIAREPVERRPTIRAWLPHGFVPRQITILSTKPSTEVMLMRSLGTTAVHPPLSGDDVLYWRCDVF